MDPLMISPILFTGFLGATALFAVTIVLLERRPVRARALARRSPRLDSAAK